MNTWVLFLKMKRINIFTRSFPLGNNETFLESEIYVANQNQCSVRIIPVIKDVGERKCSCCVYPNLAYSTIWTKICVFFKLLISKWFWLLPFQREYSPKTLVHYWAGIKYLYAALGVKEYLKKNRDLFEKEDVYYSYWFNYICLGLVLAKTDCSYYSDIQIVSRGHGYDVFTELRGLYFPYRELMFKKIQKIYSVSEEGEKYLKKKHLKFVSKISVSKLGVLLVNKDFAPVLYDGKHVMVVSCSSVIDLKRVSLIYDSLLFFLEQNPELEIDWWHFGDGLLFDKLEEYISYKKMPNLDVHLAGRLRNVEVLHQYSFLKPNVFVNLSTSEGIPVSIMEAISFGIPIIATDVGGNKEVVTIETGKLLPVNFDFCDFNQSLLDILNDMTLRDSAFSFFCKNFSASKNYYEFYDLLNQT